MTAEPFRSQLAALEQRGRLRRLSPRAGRDFASNDYLGLAGDPMIAQAVADAVARGVGEDVGGGGARTQTEFLITTGPAPVPSLDGANVVFGRVLRGLETVNAVARTPTFKPSGNSVAWNQVAEWVGDERAGKARESWSKPTKAIVITNAGVLE